MIRDARFADIQELARLCEEIRLRSIYRRSDPLDPFVAKSGLMDLLFQASKGSAKVVVSEKDGKIDGLFAGFLQPHYLISDMVTASCLMWYTSDNTPAIVAARLLERFVTWVEDADSADLIRIALTDAIIVPEQAARLMERRFGFRKSGIVMEKETR